MRWQSLICLIFQTLNQNSQIFIFNAFHITSDKIFERVITYNALSYPELHTYKDQYESEINIYT